jgi:hypothetical protein
MGAKEKYTIPYLPVPNLYDCPVSIAEKKAAVKIFSVAHRLFTK